MECEGICDMNIIMSPRYRCSSDGLFTKSATNFLVCSKCQSGEIWVSVYRNGFTEEEIEKLGLTSRILKRRFKVVNGKIVRGGKNG